MSHINKEGELIKSFTTINGYTIYPVTHNLIDIFWGVGFENTARFKWSGGEWILWRKNKSLPSDLMAALTKYRKEQ